MTGKLVTGIIVSLLVLPGVAAAAQTIVSIAPSNLQTFTPADPSLGKYFVIDFTPPATPVDDVIERAVLEINIDVSAKPRSDYMNGTPVLEVFVLKSAFAGTVDPDIFEPTLSAAVPAAVGEGRVVKIDITRIVQYYLDNPSANHGIILGSLNGWRDGEFTINTFADGSLAKLRIFYRTNRAR